MADIVKKTQEKIILAEMLVGVDPLVSTSVEDLNHYWLRNGSGEIVLTHFRGATTKVWAVDGSDDYSPSGVVGATSLVWQVNGSNEIVPI